MNDDNMIMYILYINYIKDYIYIMVIWFLMMVFTTYPSITLKHYNFVYNIIINYMNNIPFYVILAILWT